MTSLLLHGALLHGALLHSAERARATLNAGAVAVFALLMLSTAGCSNSEAERAAAEQEASDRQAREAAMLVHMQEHFDTKVSLPPSVQEALERGEVTQEGIDARTAAGEFEKFFQFKTPADLPADLTWHRGEDLADLGSDQAVKGGTLYLPLSDFPRTLRRFGPDANGSFRPWILDYAAMQFARRHPNNTSIDADGNFHYFPGIAEAWAMDRDTATVFVKIDPRARFSDGQPITADDMLFSMYMWQNPWIQAPWYNNFFNRNYLNIVRYDAHTFSMKLPEAKPNMVGRVLELEPLPKHFYSEFGEDFPQRYQWRFAPHSGAYVLKEKDLKKGRTITLTRDPEWWARDNKYWRNRFNVDKVHFAVIRETSKAFEAFRKGELSIFGVTLPEYWYEKLPADHELVANGYIERSVFYNQKPRPTYGLWMNEAQPLLNNRDIRVGINYATNWDKVIAQYFRGDYERMRTTADGYGEFSHPTLEARPFDVQKALEHFAKAGFVDRGDDGILVNDKGQRLSFNLSTGYETLKDTLTILREEALKAGIEFRLQFLDSTTAWKKVQEKQHDIHFVAFNVAAEMYPRYWETYHSVNAYDRPWLADGSVNPDRKTKPQTNNLQAIAIPELDTLIEQYRASDNVVEMQQMAFRMEEILHEDASFVPGFVIPFIRTAYWRWVKWPDDFNVKIASSATEYHLMWIEQDGRRTTQAARSDGRTFPAEEHLFDQYRSP